MTLRNTNILDLPEEIYVHEIFPFLESHDIFPTFFIISKKLITVCGKWMVMKKLEVEDLVKIMAGIPPVDEDLFTLLYYGVVGFSNKQLESILCLTCAHSLVNSCKLILNLFDEINPSCLENYCFVVSCTNGHIDIVIELIKDLRVNICAQNNAPIKMACKKGHIDLARFLLIQPEIFNSVNRGDLLLQLLSEHEKDVNLNGVNYLLTEKNVSKKCIIKVSLREDIYIKQLFQNNLYKQIILLLEYDKEYNTMRRRRSILLRTVLSTIFFGHLDNVEVLPLIKYITEDPIFQKIKIQDKLVQFTDPFKLAKQHSKPIYDYIFNNVNWKNFVNNCEEK